MPESSIGRVAFGFRETVRTGIDFGTVPLFRRLRDMVKSDEWLRKGLAHHQAGDLQAAEDLYRRVLEKRPGDADALYLLGTINYQRGSLGSAVLFLRKAVKSRPDHPEAHGNLGLALYERGDPDGAIDELRHALRLKPDYPEALYNLGNALRDREEWNEAVACYRRAIQANPTFAAAHDNLAQVLRRQGALEESLACCRRALQLDPGLAVAHNNLGAILTDLGDASGAVAAFTEATRLEPTFAEAHANLAACLLDLGELDEAESRCRGALAAKPDAAKALTLMGRVLHRQGRDAEAVETYLTALEAKPDDTGAMKGLALSLYFCRDQEGAIHWNRKALERDPDDAATQRRLGFLLCEQGDEREGAKLLDSIAHRDSETPLWNLRVRAVCPTVMDDRGQIEQYRAELLETLDSTPPCADADLLLAVDPRPSFNLPFHGCDDRPIREAFARVCAPAFDGPGGSVDTHAVRAGPIKVGFVMTRGHEKAFVKSIAGFFDHFRDQALVPTIVCDRTSLPSLRAHSANTRVEYLATTQDLRHDAVRIGKHGFDILYYWENNTDALNYFLPFHRLAPTQCTSWGIQVTTGIGSVDHYLSSEWIETPDADAHYTENLVRLKTMLAYRTRERRPDRLRDREHFDLRQDDRVYLCPQHLGKFHPDFDEILEGILQRDPRGIVLVTEGRFPKIAAALRRRFERVMPGVADRIRFLPPQAGDDYASLLLHSDVLLDPLHFGGVNTTYDAFSLGKAIVTLPSRYHRGRYTRGCYRKMGIEDCIVASPAEYIELAVRIATEPDYRHQLESEILERSDVLFEDATAARELEAWFIDVAHRQREG